MIISKDSGKAVDKIWCPFMIETLSKLRIECNFLHLIKKKKNSGIWPRWRCRQIPFSFSQNQGYYQFQNKYQSEVPENRTVQKSNSQGVKEETFIQTGRRSRDEQPGQRGCTHRLRLADWVGKAAAGRWAVLHLPVDKNHGGELGSKTNHTTQHEKNKASEPLSVKICQDCAGGRNCQYLRRVLEGPMGS